MTKVKKKATTVSFLEAILSEDNELLTPIMVIDATTRGALICAALKLETMVKENKINVGVDMEFATPMGLITKCRVEQPKPDKPYLFYFTYSINSTTLENWIREHSYLDHMWRVSSRGINIVFSGGIEKDYHLDYHKVLYWGWSSNVITYD